MSPSSSAAPSMLIYLFRRDLRIADNPVLHEISKLCGQWQNNSHTQTLASNESDPLKSGGVAVTAQSTKPITHVLPIYVFSAQQVEVSGFLTPNVTRSPYPQARSQVGRYWRCGHHRAKFLAESVWDLKEGLRDRSSDLIIRVGMVADVTKALIKELKERGTEVSAIWMTAEEGVEEKREEREIRGIAEDEGQKFKLWADEKYFVDDRDIPFKNPKQIPDVFTSFRKSVEPLRQRPRPSLPTPQKLPSLPDNVPEQASPFTIPDNKEDLITALMKPLKSSLMIRNVPKWPPNVSSAHAFHGGEKTGHERIKHLVESSSMTTYKSSRNGLLGTDFSTKLAGWLALGCVTARQVHEYLLAFEDGSTELGCKAKGYGHGENVGTAAVRFELLWRDYMRLCTRKFGPRLFQVEGFRMDESTSWRYLPDDGSGSGRTEKQPGASKSKVSSASQRNEVAAVVERFLEGRTGTGLIDASMRELFLTGYTSNRARQNVASYLARHLGVDWRLGAEWYECMLVDYDVSSNWGNWQYVAGVGNDPRTSSGGATAGRVFNPVKQALDYDHGGEYVRSWIPELRGLKAENKQDLMKVFQAWKVSEDERIRLGLKGLEWVENPLKKISFGVGSGTGHGGNSFRGNHGHFRGKSKGKVYKDRRLGNVDKANAAAG